MKSLKGISYMKKSLHALFCTICALFFIPVSVQATDYTIETLPAPATPKLAVGIPLTISTSSASSVTQQVYLASELSALGATAGDVTGIKLYYGGKNNNNAVPSVTRSIKIYMTEIATDSLKLDTISGYTTYYRFKFKSAGTYVYSGSITTEALSAGEIKTLSITFNQSSYAWDGSKNVLLTVFDVTNTAYSSTEANLRFVYMPTGHPRFVHQYWMTSSSGKASDYLPPATLAGLEGYSATSGDAGTAQDKQVRGHLLVPKITFSITPAAVAVPVPENLSTTSVTTTSARLLWDAVDGSTGYNVQWGTNSGSLDHSASNVSNNYLDINELVDGTTYYFAVQTIKDEETSSYSEEESFETTAITITYKDIVFKKWNSTTALPSEAGNYYLNDDVALSAQYTLPGDINLCLNGKELYTYLYNIKVPDEASLAIYDNIGGGRIYGRYVASMSTGYGLISVENGGELVLGEGAVENLYGYYVDEEDPSQSEDPDASYAISINNGGSFKLSGAPTLSAAKACIYLLTNTPRITIESGKPLTNLSAYSVDATAQTITFGWANMSGADPNVYLVSAKSGYKGIILNGGEVKFVPLSDLDVSLNESSAENESKLTAALGTDVSLAITRSSLTNAQYNTICLPYAMDDDEMQLRFGEGYDLEEFVSSSLDGDELSLVFNQVDALEAGKPYLLKPSINAPALSYLSVNIAAASPVDQTSDEFISFHGTFGPTELAGGNKNLLFLGADNELLWPDATGNLKGFRAYFEVKGAAAQAAKRARIVKKEDSATGIETVESRKTKVESSKVLRNGQLLILRDNKTYNVLGIECR